MNDWYLAGRAHAGSGNRTAMRAAAERLVGSNLTARMARQASVAVAATRRRLTRTGQRSDAALTALRDAFRGEQCIIIGNGPSLNQTDMTVLAGRHTFGLNRLYMMFDELGFSTEFHVVVNQLVVEQVAEDLTRVPGMLFSTWRNQGLLKERADAIYLHSVVGPLFSTDVRHGVWEGATVTYVAMQLAYFMGFQEAILIGVDHRFNQHGKPHQVIESDRRDEDHFDPNYFGKGFRWQLPDLQTSEVAYHLARKAFERDGRRVVDCTVGGALAVFPKDDLARTLW